MTITIISKHHHYQQESSSPASGIILIKRKLTTGQRGVDVEMKEQLNRACTYSQIHCQRANKYLTERSFIVLFHDWSLQLEIAILYLFVLCRLNQILCFRRGHNRRRLGRLEPSWSSSGCCLGKWSHTWVQVFFSSKSWFLICDCVERRYRWGVLSN